MATMLSRPGTCENTVAVVANHILVAIKVPRLRSGLREAREHSYRCIRCRKGLHCEMHHGR